MPALAEQISGPWQYELTSEGLVITGYMGLEQDVVIPDEIGGNKVSVIGREAFRENHIMQTLVIPEGVTAIRSQAFYGCTGLSWIEFNAKNCTVPDIWIYSNDAGVGVFSGAGAASSTGLTVVFGDKVTRVPDHLFDTASLDEYGKNGYPFASVTAVELSDSIKEIGSFAFRNCQQLEEVRFGARVKTIGNSAFWGCSALPALAFDDALVSIGEAAFYGNAALEDIAWGAGLESIGVGAFQSCTSLETVVCVNPLTTIDRNAFRECTALRTLSLPESLVNLNANAFYGCIKLGELEINSANLTTPDIWIYSDEGGVGVFSGAGSASVTGLRVTFGDKVSRVPDHLFDTASLSDYGKNGYPYAFVTEVVFSDAMQEVGSCAFRNCQALESVTFGAKLQSIASLAFWNCTALDNLFFDDALLAIGESAFANNASLETIAWGDGLESIGIGAFRACNSLEELTLVSPLTTIGRLAFADCVGLKTLTVPESVTQINASAFYNCIKLQSIALNCPALTVPEVWIYSDDGGVGVFSGAGSASTAGLKVTFGSNVTKVPDRLFETASIDAYGHNGYPYAFITEVELPESITEVGAYAFRNCQNLITVRFNGMDATFGDNVFEGCTSPEFHVECPTGGFVEWFALSAGYPCVNIEPQESAGADDGEADDILDELWDEPAEEEVSDGTWTCSNGHAGNTGNFCPECGEARPVTACPSCGYDFPEGAHYNFCPNCGAQIG